MANVMPSNEGAVYLRVAADNWRGSAQFVVLVDGVQFGEVRTTEASYWAGQWEDLYVGPSTSLGGAHKVSVKFLNDYSDSGGDRNVYVGGLSVGGREPGLASAVGGLSVTGWQLAPAVALYTNGQVDFHVENAKVPEKPAAPPTQTDPVIGTPSVPPVPTSTPIEMKVSADAWQGAAQFTMHVNGQQVGGVYSTSASASAGEWDVIKAYAYVSPQDITTVTLTFINDAAGPGGDRNLYVDRIAVNGNSYEAEFGKGGTTILGPNLIGYQGLFVNGSLEIATKAKPAPGNSSLSLLGINFSGAENTDADLAKWGSTSIFPTTAEMDYFAKKGLNVFRLAFNWERLQPKQGGPLNPEDLAQIRKVVEYAGSLGVKVVLDLHNFGYGYGAQVGSAATPNSSFANFWGRLAKEFIGNSNVIFQLMNEPHEQSATSWLGSTNAAIQAIRAVGADQMVLVSGSYWSGAASWVTSDNDTVIGAGVIDPLNNYAFDVHNYFDGNGSGVGGYAVSADIGVDRLRAVTEWAEMNGAKLFLGEFGSATDATSLSALDSMLRYMEHHSNVWLGGTYWEAGRGYKYYFTINPENGIDALQMDVLEKFAPGLSPIVAIPPTGMQLTGTPGADVLTGGSGADVIAGGRGSDILTGGDGADIFLFNTTLNAANNVDRITDFAPRADQIALDVSIFSGLKASSPRPLTASEFAFGTKATTSAQRILYDAKTGAIYYDADGVGKAAPVKFAQLEPNLQLSAADFIALPHAVSTVETLSSLLHDGALI